MITNSSRCRRRLVALVLVTLVAGCEPKQESTVTGRVTLDGKPLQHGSVVFKAGDPTQFKFAAGDITKDGAYLVQIGQSGKVISGEYQVEVSARGPSTPHPQGGPPTPGELITPRHYASSETSGLRYIIRPGENTIDIALVSDAPVTVNEDDAQRSEPSTDEGDGDLNEPANAAIESDLLESGETDSEGPAEQPADADAKFE